MCSFLREIWKLHQSVNKPAESKSFSCEVERQGATFCMSEEHHLSIVLLHSAGTQRQNSFKIMSAYSPALKVEPVTILCPLIHWGTWELVYAGKLFVEKSWKQNAISEIYAKRKRLNLRNKASFGLLASKNSKT